MPSHSTIPKDHLLCPTDWGKLVLAKNGQGYRCNTCKNIYAAGYIYNLWKDPKYQNQVLKAAQFSAQKGIELDKNFLPNFGSPYQAPKQEKPKYNCVACGEPLMIVYTHDAYECLTCEIQYSAQLLYQFTTGAKKLPQFVEHINNEYTEESWQMRWRCEVRFVPHKLFYNQNGSPQWRPVEEEAIYSPEVDYDLVLNQSVIDELGGEDIERYVLGKIKETFNTTQQAMSEEYLDHLLDRYVTRGLKKLLDRKDWSEHDKPDPEWASENPTQTEET